jgi:uncharacterized membrane protein
MKMLTKISVLIPIFFIIMTAYGFAAFIGYHINHLPAPVSLLITGATMVAAGHILKNQTHK